MSSLNWEAFERLPGAADVNFELLCRSAVRRTYGRYGDFNARANQPGVEFHLQLHTACPLGKPGEWFGWQCRWYDLPGVTPLGAARRKKIEEAIATAHKHLPSLTHWVLWTRRPLAALDQRWFIGLTAPFRLVQWTAAEVGEHLTGEAAILRATYFGDLVLTPTSLADIHARAVAPVRSKWMPEAHQPVRTEREIRRMMGESAAWNDLDKSAEQISSDLVAAERDLARLAGVFAPAATEVVAYVGSVAAAVELVRGRLVQGNFDALQQILVDCPGRPEPLVASLPRRLRAARHPAAPTVTNVLAATAHARELCKRLTTATSCRLIAVSAEAGCGKTELAAQLTAPTVDRPAGILLHGRDLRAGDNLDSLVRTVVIHGTPARSIEALIAALDAAGQRAGRRMPLVIDGLNEAEDPRDWKGGLASLVEILRPYAHVLVVCTLRPAFVEEALPKSVRMLEIPGFDQDTSEAVHRYFVYYRINPADADLPWDLLSHPLSLRIFCEVTNPDRKREVGVEAMPSSLTALFERYLDKVAERIADLAPRRNRYYKADIRKALVVIGMALWDQNVRQLAIDDLQRRIDDLNRPWDESLTRALEQDGLLLRDARDPNTASQQLSISYDRLAGHLVANALLERHGRAGLQEFLREPRTVIALHEADEGRHPLGGDILIGLVGLTPRRFQGEQVWKMVDEPLRGIALYRAAWLDGASLDAATVEELATVAARPDEYRFGLFDRLFEVRAVDAHPLNAEFLDRVLRAMTTAGRDAHWTEWLRRNEGQILDDVRWLEGRWRASCCTSSERLRALWTLWILTSSVRLLRDHATRALYWFGRGNPGELFELALNSLAIDDPSVPERAMAASFGVVMAHQLPDDQFIPQLRGFLAGLADRLLAPVATHATDHWLIRLYVQGCWDLATKYHRNAVPIEGSTEGPLPFASGPSVDPISADDGRAGEVDGTLEMDFENYTLGRLVSKRRNYDMSHPGHRAVVAHVRGAVWALGWRQRPFGTIDQEIAANDRYRRASGKIDRYGKKYGWAGFYTYAGKLANAGQLPDDDRLSDLGIDPSFPEPAPTAPLTLPPWTASIPEDDVAWLRSGQIVVPDDFLYRAELDGTAGPWAAVYASLSSVDESDGRDVFGRLLAVLVQEPDADKLKNFLGAGRDLYLSLPEIPDDYYTFAGEIPWSHAFGQRARKYTDDPYKETLQIESGAEVEVEVLAHIYAWESYHSVLNGAGGGIVPSRSFSTAFDLRGVPQLFDQKEPNGVWATKSFKAPVGFKGKVLYIRVDLLERYAAGRKLLWWFSGERRLDHRSESLSEVLREIFDGGEYQWQIVRRGAEFCPSL